jgi:hypothetical protein
MPSTLKDRFALVSAGLMTVALITVPALASAGQGAAKNEQVTFSKDIAPILQRSCQNCHRPNSVAPMSLLTYEETRPWARSIKQRTGLRDKPLAMPPWFMEKNIGIQQYKDDISLNDEEVAKIAKWVDNGAPQGNLADMPPPRTFPDASKWQLGEPDLVVSSPTVEIGEAAPDWWGPIGQVPMPAAMQDRYIASVEMREVNDLAGKPERQTIGSFFIIHHLHAGLQYPDGGSVRLPTHEVGRNADVYDADAGLLMKANSILDFNVGSVHLHSNGRRTKAHVEYGFRFHPKGYVPTKKLYSVGAATVELDIKGMEANQKFEAFTVLQDNTKIMNYEPHMHANGVRMCLDAIYGSTTETLSCSGYNHGWVRVYTYADDAQPLLAKGTILRITGYFDNTPANKNVADPRNWSGLGHRSMDNMMINIAQGVRLTDEEFQQELVKRRQKLHLTGGETVPGCPLCGASGVTVTRTANQQQ